METNSSFFKPSQKDRSYIANIIYKNHKSYDGFVITHGTDTLVETASALNYMLSGLNKPIILTGSQLPMWNLESDGPRNLISAVKVAKRNIHEPIIVFGDYILKGSKASKVDEKGFNAFDTPNHPRLGEIIAIGEGINLEKRLLEKPKKGELKIFTDFDPRIFHLAQPSGAYNNNLLKKIIKSDDVQAILFGGFGAGNVPGRFIPFLSEATKLYKPVFVYTRCGKGSADMGIYAVGAAAKKNGAISAGDMTLEALGQKMMFALGKSNLHRYSGKEKLDYVKNQVLTPINGDIKKESK